ncbi:MAG: hypothetical protein ACREJW_09570, partial [Candidatus Methylomirabilales bacterium]
IPLLSFKSKITREAVLVHREETPEQRGGTAPRASQAEAPGDDLSDVLKIHQRLLTPSFYHT